MSTDPEQQDGIRGYESMDFEYRYDWQEGPEHPGESGGDNDSRIIYYSSEDYISGPIRVKNGSVPINILEFQYPFQISEMKCVRKMMYSS